ncbi:MAG: hypothetical protein JSS20_19800, partial [Proteobacteria bacterium]|nr:hypothetical protein [Pseudomonadota bacterium]
MIERRTAPGLAWALTVRLATTMIVVMVLQAGAVSVRDYLNETDFLNSYVRRESLNIARAIGDSRAVPGKHTPVALPSQYTGPYAAHYAFRAVEADGKIIAEHNSDRLAPLSPWSDRPLQRQDFWVRKLDRPERMYVVGGVKVRQPSGQIWVEIATFGDPQGTYLPNLLRDILDDVWVPA